MTLIRFSILFFLLLLSNSCKKIEQDNIVFIGDSLIRNFDTEKFFPYLNINNIGIDGLKIKDCALMNNFYEDSTIVILIGTNNLKDNLSEQDINEISDEYYKLVSSFVCNKIICISILPRYDIQSNIIELFNITIKNKVSNINNCFFLDVFNDFLYKNSINPDYTTDGIHLSDKGYHVLSSKLSRYI